jgi:hypothetical protein
MLLKRGSYHHNYRRNTPNTLFRPIITPLCQDVRDTLMSRFSALALVAWRHSVRRPRGGRSAFYYQLNHEKLRVRQVNGAN